MPVTRRIFNPGTITKTRSIERGEGLGVRPTHRSLSSHNIRATTMLAEYDSTRSALASIVRMNPELDIKGNMEATAEAKTLPSRDQPFKSYMDQSLDLYQTQLHLQPYYSKSSYNTDPTASYAGPSNPDGVSDDYHKKILRLVTTNHTLKLRPNFTLTPSLGPKAYYSANYWQNKRLSESQKSMDLSRQGGLAYYQYMKNE